MKKLNHVVHRPSIKFLLIFTLILLLSILRKLDAQSINERIISIELLEEIEQNPDGFYDMQIILLDRVDVREISQNMSFGSSVIPERLPQLINQLQEKARLTQQPILDFLSASGGVKNGTIKPLWITNLIEVKANHSVLAALSQRSDIELISSKPKNVLLASGSADCATLTENGVEPGLKTINAHRMWELGYTGYGRKALIMDTGEDQAHPAIRSQYYGNQVPDSLAWSGFGGPEVGGHPHGTHVTGTICGLDRLKNDTIGVAFNAQWIGGPIRLDETSYKQEVRSILETFQWALDPDGNPNTFEDMPDVINNSWGYMVSECTDYLADVSAVLELAGIAVVWAAGNSGPDEGTIVGHQNWNESLVNTFTVGALQQDGFNTIAPFSSRGPSECPGTGSLLIKPEVSAPGVSVRSCIPGGGYARWGGTSMASPHVAGAILLLKEAFPFLTGEELKLALYFSAVDLGEPGEDNTYGMGLIDVYAAYQYLINAGNQPMPPKSIRHDLVIAGVQTEDVYCDESVTFSAFVQNSGEDTILNFSYTVEGHHMGPSVFRSDTISYALIPGEMKEVLINYDRADLLAAGNSNGSYISLRISVSPLENVEERKLNNTLNFQLLVPEPLTPATRINSELDSTVCQGTRASIEVEWDRSYTTAKWYTRERGGNTIATTNQFITPVLDKNTTFYFSPTFNGLGAILPTSNDILFDFPPDSAGLTIKSEVPQRLVSTSVYANKKGGLLVMICDQNNSCTPKTFFINEGQNTLKLNYSLRAQETYKVFKLSGVDIGFTTEHDGYPYQYPDLFTIVGSPHSIDEIKEYYYFFDIEVEPLHICNRTPVEVHTIEAENVPMANFDLPDTVEWKKDMAISISNTSIDADSWTWDFGDKYTSMVEHPDHIYEAPGRYLISLEAKNSTNKCNDFYEKEVVLTEEIMTGIEDPSEIEGTTFKIFPNPASHEITIQASSNVSVSSVRIFNSTGHFVFEVAWDSVNEDGHLIRLPHLVSGIYFLHLYAADNSIIGTEILSLE